MERKYFSHMIKDTLPDFLEFKDQIYAFIIDPANFAKIDITTTIVMNFPPPRKDRYA